MNVRSSAFLLHSSGCFFPLLPTVGGVAIASDTLFSYLPAPAGESRARVMGRSSWVESWLRPSNAHHLMPLTLPQNGCAVGHSSNEQCENLQDFKEPVSRSSRKSHTSCDMACGSWHLPSPWQWSPSTWTGGMGVSRVPEPRRRSKPQLSRDHTPKWC